MTTCFLYSDLCTREHKQKVQKLPQVPETPVNVKEKEGQVKTMGRDLDKIPKGAFEFEFCN